MLDVLDSILNQHQYAVLLFILHGPAIATLVQAAEGGYIDAVTGHVNKRT